MNGKLCTKCNTVEKLSYHQYCYTCLRISKGQNPTPKFRRDVTNKTMCSKCKVNPKLSYHRYCQECKNKSNIEWQNRNGGSWAALTDEGRRKATVRAYINHKVHRGQLERKPCEMCGMPSEHHHLDYENQTLNVKHLCRKCHGIAHKK